MKVSEIFQSIEGEGIRAGYPCVFIRLHGCNLNCSYCDSSYACKGTEYTNLSIDEIVQKVRFYNISRVTITGGEPLIHKESVDLIRSLIHFKIEVNVETNGSIDLTLLSDLYMNPYLIITMDWKSISSNESTKMLQQNLKYLTYQDVLKFVVGTEQDLNQMKELIYDKNPCCNIYVSPVYNQLDPSKIVQFLLDNHLDEVRVQLQLHKFIWDPNMRGV